MVTSIGAMLATCLISVIMRRHNGIDNVSFTETNLMSMANFLIVIGCAIEGAVLVIFVLLAKRHGITSGGVCAKTSVLLIYGAVTVGFGVSYIIIEHAFTLLSWNMRLVGIASEVVVMLVAILGIQFAACGCYKNTVYDLVTSSGILGCCLGCLRAYQVDTYFGSLLIENSWQLVGDILIYTSFYCGSLSLAASLIARAHLNRSFIYLCCGILLPLALAGGFGSFTMYPVYDSSHITHTIARYCVGGGGAGVACMLAVAAFAPFKVPRATKPPRVVEDTDSIKFAKSLMTPSALPKSESSDSSV